MVQMRTRPAPPQGATPRQTGRRRGQRRDEALVTAGTRAHSQTRQATARPPTPSACAPQVYSKTHKAQHAASSSRTSNAGSEAPIPPTARYSHGTGPTSDYTYTAPHARPRELVGHERCSRVQWRSSKGCRVARRSRRRRPGRRAGVRSVRKGPVRHRGHVDREGG